YLALLPGLPGTGRPPRDPVETEQAVQKAAETAEAEGLPVVACQAWQLLALLRREEGFDAADAALERMLSISTEHALPVWRVEALVRLGANAFM
ncbi:hypothetical protein G3M53_58570, partial [Streptomyces sp. SID7982]|nr:hypothetical protein [Streptomyces sp. SID7982]